jgi:hypothetical protein
LKRRQLGQVRANQTHFQIPILTELRAGDKCGATFVNRNFSKWFAEKLGERIMEKIPREKLREGSKIAREFEAAKMAYDGSPCKFYISIPREAKIDDDPAKGIEDGELVLTQ